MIILPDSYVGSSCVIKTKKNDLLTMGTLNKIRDKYIDVSDTRNEFPEIAYNRIVKIEIYNSRLGFRVLIGNIYISTKKLLRIINLNEATNQEHREYFRITVYDDAYIYNLASSVPVSDETQIIEPQVQGKDSSGGKSERNAADGTGGLPAHLVDISLGGVLIKSRLDLHIDDEFCLKIPNLGADILYKCIVRRLVDFDGRDKGAGCEFLDMSVLQEDLLYRFILKKQNEQLKRVR